MIDLGVLGAEAPPAEAAPRRRTARRPPRSLAVLVVLVLSLLGLAGGQPPGAAGLRVLATVPALSASQYAILDGALYVAEAAPGGNRITAYRLRDGRALWSTPVTVLASLVAFQSTGGVLLASMVAPGVSGDHTVALDERTGAVLWHVPDILEAVVPAAGRALMILAYGAGPGVGPGVLPSDKLGTFAAAVGLRDGREAWRYWLAPGCQYAVDADSGAAARMAVLCRGPTVDSGPDAGRVTADDLRTVDLSTGGGERRATLTVAVVQATGPAQLLPAGSSALFGPVVSVVPGRVLVGVAQNGGAELTAYEPATLRPLWTRRMTDNDYGATPCADALCLSDGSGLTVVDPGTGAVRWRTAERAYTEPPGPLAGRLLVEPLGGARAMLVEAGTGRPVLDLSGWQAVSAATGATPVFARWQRPPDGRVLFATVTGDPLAVRLIGFDRDVLQDACRADGPYLVCQTLGGDLRLWRYGP